MALPDVEEKESTNPVERDSESNRQPLWHVVVLSVLTIFTYPFFWFYKNLKQLKAVADASDEITADISPSARAALSSIRKCKPGWFTLGLLVPVFHILLVWQFFAWSVQLCPRANWFGGRHPIIAGAALTTLTVALLSLGFHKGTGPEYLFALNAAIPLAFAQHLLNEFWHQIEQPKKIVRQAFSAGELLALIFGGVLLGLVLAGSAMK